MNLFAVTYIHEGVVKTLLIESEWTDTTCVHEDLHPAIYTKVNDIEFIGSFA